MVNELDLGDRFEMDSALFQKLSEVFSKTSPIEKSSILEIICREYSPQDLASVIQCFPSERHLQVYSCFSNIHDKVIFVESAESPTKRIIIKSIDDHEVAELVSKISADHAVKIVEMLPLTRDFKVMGMIDSEKAELIFSRRKYSPDSVGRLMDEKFFAFSQETSLSKVVSFIRENPDIDFLKGIFVLDANNGLCGTLQLRSLLTCSDDMPLSMAMSPITYSVGPSEQLANIIEFFERYSISTLPVTDDSGSLLGVITQEDVIEFIEDKADKVMGHVAGIKSGFEPAITLLGSVFFRAPWLSITLIAGLMNAGNLSRLPAACKMLVTFVPLINGMSGNVGIQCSTVLVRSMTPGFASNLSLFSSVRREFMVGATLGLLFGIITGTLVCISQLIFVMYTGELSAWQLGIVVCSGLCGACLLATTLGVVCPVIFDRAGFDPAIASGPIVTALNDVCSTWMYFLIVKELVGFFVQ